MDFRLDPSKDKWLTDNKLVSLTATKPSHTDSDGTEHYRVTLRAITHTFHPALQNIPMWSFGPKSPGDLIVAKRNVPVEITWFNALGSDNLKNLLLLGVRQGMEEDHMMTKSHNQVHMHGARVPWTSDGFPESVFHSGEGRIFHYPNNQPAATLWYHDHAMDVTRLNVYAGLFGAYILRDPDEADVLPAGELEIPLILQDKSFDRDANGDLRLYYEQSVSVNPAHQDKNEPSTVAAQPEFVGDYPVVNGQIWPLLELAPRIYRLRLLNGANTRFFNLTLAPESDPEACIPFWVIGTEGGFLDQPAKVTPLLLAPGERVDLLVDLRGLHENDSLLLRNDAPAPYSGDPGDHHFASKAYKKLDIHDPGNFCCELLKIVITGQADATDSKFDPKTIQLPPRVDPLSHVKPHFPQASTFDAINRAIDEVKLHVMDPQTLKAAGVTFKLRRFKLEEYQLQMDTLAGMRVPSVQINGKSWKDAEPVSTTLNAVEVWEFLNVTPDTHPMHIHLVQFRVLSRTWLTVVDDPSRATADLTEPKDARNYTVLEGGVIERAKVENFEKGWKDTVRCNPKQSTRVLIRFDGFSGDYVYHCHILEHEDMGMMYRLKVEG